MCDSDSTYYVKSSLYASKEFDECIYRLFTNLSSLSFWIWHQIVIIICSIFVTILALCCWHHLINHFWFYIFITILIWNFFHWFYIKLSNILRVWLKIHSKQKTAVLKIRTFDIFATFSFSSTTTTKVSQAFLRMIWTN